MMDIFADEKELKNHFSANQSTITFIHLITSYLFTYLLTLAIAAPEPNLAQP